MTEKRAHISRLVPYDAAEPLANIVCSGVRILELDPRMNPAFSLRGWQIDLLAKPGCEDDSGDRARVGRLTLYGGAVETRMDLTYVTFSGFLGEWTVNPDGLPEKRDPDGDHYRYIPKADRAWVPSLVAVMLSDEP